MKYDIFTRNNVKPYMYEVRMNNPKFLDVELAKLRLDLKNPRFPKAPDSQRQALEEMAREQGSKLLTLARHIVRNGLSPAHRFIVIPDDDSQYIVLDANRRLTALRVLENPELAERAGLVESDMRQLRALSDSWEPPDDVPCVAFRHREDADPWIQLIHEGEADGAGLVEWSAQQKQRYRAQRTGTPAHIQVLDFVMNEGTLSAETTRRYDRGKYPVSTLERVLSNPYVREKLGLAFSQGQVLTHFPKPEVLKGLTKVVDDIGSGKVKVGDVLSKDDRVRYIEGYKSSELPNSSSLIDAPTPITEAPEPKKSKKKEHKRSNTRTKLVPSGFALTIDKRRINDIYLELKTKLRVDDVPNAAGVLLRTFLELSVDEYIRRNAVAIPTRPSLAQKVTAVVDFMEEHGTMNKDQAVPVKEAVKSPDKVHLTTNLNALAHNPDMTIGGKELKDLWDRLETFFDRLWA